MARAQSTRVAPTRTGLPRGLNSGHKTTPRVLPNKPSHFKGRASKRTTVRQKPRLLNRFVRSIVREVAGFAPYERRVMELIRNSKDKKARKLTKRRVSSCPHFLRSTAEQARLTTHPPLSTILFIQLGTLRRAKRKVDELTGVIAETRRAGH
ncbi:60S ribosomal protein L36 [Puccinia sorghi]|uniref:60S ribosomal protein L36 n=1 Tax=Puccinia sorghi TaxID=27349 RepID=A0A0L6U6J7_9BASI|nr:60S ribosomal protein L36 [Puccinia sorghi]